MKPGFLITVFYPCLFGVMALFFLVIGLRGIVSRRPFLVSARWFIALVVLGLSPAMLQGVMLPSMGGGSISAIRWFSPIMLVVVLVFLAFTLRGYMAFGVTDVSFREGLLHSLGKLNLPYEETLSAIKLTTIGVDLQVAVQSWIGTGQIKAKGRQTGGVLRDVVSGMNDYYQSGAVSKVNLTGCIFYTVMGVLMAGFAGLFFFAFGKIL